MPSTQLTRQQTERELQEAVTTLARMLGYSVAHFNDSRRQVRPRVFVGDRDAKGWPDLVLCRGRLIIAELKREDGKLTTAQRQWIDALSLAGAEVCVWRPSDWDEIVAVLTRRDRPARAA